MHLRPDQKKTLGERDIESKGDYSEECHNRNDAELIRVRNMEVGRILLGRSLYITKLIKCMYVCISIRWVRGNPNYVT